MKLNDRRFTAAAENNPLGSLAVIAMQNPTRWVEAIREPGFRAMQALIDADRAEGFRSAAPLMDDAQKQLDKQVVAVGLQRLSLVADLLSAGLTYPIADPLSVTQLEWYASNKVGAAQRTMSPSARGESKLPDLLPYRLPIYLTTDFFKLDIRTLKASQRVGMPLDTNLAGQCTRSVNEALEDAAINGATTLDGNDLVSAGYSAPGILNAPNAETGNFTLAAWTTAPVGATVYNETQGALNQLRANNKFGPYRMYVGTTVSAALDADYDTTSGSRGLTIRERLLKLDGLQAIRMADMMPADKVAIVQMTSDVIDIVTGQAPTVIPWTSLDGFTIYNLVMAIMVPRVRSDYNGDSGIFVGTLA